MSPEERTDALASLAALRPALLRVAHYLSRDSSRAEDLVQATLLSGIEHIDSWQGRGPLKNWLIRILTNQNRREQRNREATVETVMWEQLAADAGWASDAEFESSERIGQVQRAILQLSEDDRELLLLRDVEGIEGNEAAEILGLTLAAIKSRLHRARLRLLAAIREGYAVPHQVNADHTMTCMEVLQCLGDYVDGSLGPPAVASVDAHLRNCDRCRLFSRRYTTLLAQLPEIRAVDDASGSTTA